MSKSKKEYQEPVVEQALEYIAEETIEKEETPIEESPKEAVFERAEIEEKVPEEKTIIKPVLKKKGKVILITRDGCIVDHKGTNVRLYGKEFMAYHTGDIIEY